MEDLITRKQMRTILSSLKDYVDTNREENLINIKQTTLYSGNDPITSVDGYTEYTLLDNLNNYDYIFIEFIGNYKNGTENHVVTGIYSVNNELLNNEDEIVYLGNNQGGSSTTSQFGGWLRFPNNNTARFGVRYIGSVISEVYLRKIVGIKTVLSTNNNSQVVNTHTLALLHLNGDLKDEFCNSDGWWFNGSGGSIDTTNQKFGSGCAKITGSGTLRSTKSIRFNFYDGDFTVECWFKVNDISDNQSIFSRTEDFKFGAFIAPDGHIYYFMSNNGSGWDMVSGDSDQYNGIGSHTVTANVWHHFAYVRKANKLYGFLDGQKDLEVNIDNTAMVSSNLPIRFGRWGGGKYQYNGYFDEIRISDIARYTENFTPQTEPFDDVYGE